MSSSRSSSCSASIASCSCSRHRLPERVIGGPVRLVEGAPGRVDRAVHVLFRRVGDLTERLLGGRVDVGEGACLAVDELAVDHHLRSRTETSAMVLALLRLRVWCSHGCGRRAPKSAESWDPHHQARHVVHGRRPAEADWRSTAFARRIRPDAGRTAPSRRAPWRVRRRTSPATWRHVASSRASALVHGAVVGRVRSVEVTAVRRARRR